MVKTFLRHYLSLCLGDQHAVRMSSCSNFEQSAWF